MFSLSCAAARSRTWQKNAAQQFPIAAQWFLMSYVWYTFDGNQAAELWTLVWRVETGCRSTEIDVTDFCVVFGDVCEKNLGAHCMNMCRSNTILFSAQWKKLQGTLMYTDPRSIFHRHWICNRTRCTESKNQIKSSAVTTLHSYSPCFSAWCIGMEPSERLDCSRNLMQCPNEHKRLFPATIAVHENTPIDAWCMSVTL